MNTRRDWSFSFVCFISQMCFYITITYTYIDPAPSPHARTVVLLVRAHLRALRCTKANICDAEKQFYMVENSSRISPKQNVSVMHMHTHMHIAISSDDWHTSEISANVLRLFLFDNQRERERERNVIEFLIGQFLSLFRGL
jgi:hypothetical protein